MSRGSGWFTGMWSQPEEAAQAAVAPSVVETAPSVAETRDLSMEQMQQAQDITSPELELVVQRAAERAVSQAQDLVEEVMREALPMMKESLRKEIAEERLAGLSSLKSEVSKETRALQTQFSTIKEEVGGLGEMVKSLGSNTGPKSGAAAPANAHLEQKLAVLLADVRSLQATQRQSGLEDLLRRVSALEKVTTAQSPATMQQPEKTDFATRSAVEALQQQLRVLEQTSVNGDLQRKHAGLEQVLQELRTEVTTARRDLKQHKEEQLVFSQAEQKKIHSMIEAVTSSCDQQFAQSVTRADLDRLREQMASQSSTLRGNVMNSIANDIQELQDQIEKEAKSNHASRDLLDTMQERVNSQLLEIRGQMNAMQTLSAERPVQADGANTATGGDLQLQATIEYMKQQISDVDARLSSLRSHLTELNGTSINDQISKLRSQMQEVWTTLSETPRKQDFATRGDLEALREAYQLDLRGHATKDHVTSSISNMNANLSEIRTQMSQYATRGDLDLWRDQTSGQMSDLHGHVQELRKVSDFQPRMQAQISDLNTHVSDLRRSSDFHAQSVSELNGHVVGLRGLSDAHSQIQTQLSDLHGHVTGLRGLSDSHSQMQAEVSELNGHIKGLRGLSDSHAQMQAHLSDLNGHVTGLRSLSESHSQVQSQLSDLHGHVKGLRGLSDSHSEMQAQLSDLHGHVTGLRGLSDSHSQMQSQLSDLHGHVTGLRGLSDSHSQMQARLSDLDGHVTGLRSLSESHSEMQSQLSDLNGHVTGLRGLSESHSQVQAQLADLNGHVTGLRNLSDSHSQIQEQLSDLNGHVTGMRGLSDSHAQMQAHLSDLNGHVTGLRSLSESHSEVQAQLSDLHGHVTGLRSLSDSHSQMQSQLSDLHGHVTGLRSEPDSASLEQQIQSAVAESLESMKAEAAQQNAMITTLANSCDDHFRFIQNSGVNQTDLATLREDLQGKVANLQEALAALQKPQPEAAAVSGDLEMRLSRLDRQVADIGGSVQNIVASSADKEDTLKTNLQMQVGALREELSGLLRESEKDHALVRAGMLDFEAFVKAKLDSLDESFQSQQSNIGQKQLEDAIQAWESQHSHHAETVRSSTRALHDEHRASIDEEFQGLRGDVAARHQTLDDFCTDIERKFDTLVSKQELLEMQQKMKDLSEAQQSMREARQDSGVASDDLKAQVSSLLEVQQQQHNAAHAAFRTEITGSVESYMREIRADLDSVCGMTESVANRHEELAREIRDKSVLNVQDNMNSHKEAVESTHSSLQERVDALNAGWVQENNQLKIDLNDQILSMSGEISKIVQEVETIRSSALQGVQRCEQLCDKLGNDHKLLKEGTGSIRVEAQGMIGQLEALSAERHIKQQEDIAEAKGEVEKQQQAIQGFSQQLQELAESLALVKARSSVDESGNVLSSLQTIDSNLEATRNHQTASLQEIRREMDRHTVRIGELAQSIQTVKGMPTNEMLAMETTNRSAALSAMQSTIDSMRTQFADSVEATARMLDMIKLELSELTPQINQINSLSSLQDELATLKARMMEQGEVSLDMANKLSDLRKDVNALPQALAEQIPRLSGQDNSCATSVQGSQAGDDPGGRMTMPIPMVTNTRAPVIAEQPRSISSPYSTAGASLASPVLRSTQIGTSNIQAAPSAAGAYPLPGMTSMSGLSAGARLGAEITTRPSNLRDGLVRPATTQVGLPHVGTLSQETPQASTITQSPVIRAAPNTSGVVRSAASVIAPGSGRPH